MENIGMQWKTEHGLFKLNIDSIRWIEKNVKTSFYNNSRSFIYNKAFAEWFKAPELWGDDVQTKQVVKCSKKPLKMFELIREWAQTRGL